MTDGTLGTESAPVVRDESTIVHSGSASDPTTPPAQNAAASTATPLGNMPAFIFFLETFYLVVLVTVFVIDMTSSSFRHNIPSTIGPLPVGIVWFGALGAVIASFRGIFAYNHQKWNSGYNYWHYSRPLIGAVTGSMGALIYWVLISLGSQKAPLIEPTTFYVAAFAFGFADWAFMAMLQNVTNAIIGPGSAATNNKAPSQSGDAAPSVGDNN
jgi:hypothetical protein